MRTIHLELVYGQRPDGSSPILPAPYGLIGYGDSNFAGDPEDRKSVMGYCFFLNGAVVSWSSKKQRTVSTSTTEAEYIAIGHAAREGVWIKRFINELGLETTGLSLKGDNEASLILRRLCWVLSLSRPKRYLAKRNSRSVQRSRREA